MANEPAACQRERFTRLFGEMVLVGEVVGGIPACVRTNEQIDQRARNDAIIYVKLHALTRYELHNEVHNGRSIHNEAVTKRMAS